MATNLKDRGDEDGDTEPEADERPGPAERRCGISLGGLTEDTD